MRFLFIALLYFVGFDSYGQTAQVAPLTGEWDYGENRCGTLKFGYPSEAAAVSGGARRFYAPVCDWTGTPRTGWGTPENQTRGACGSTQRYPKYSLGIESRNTRSYSIAYRYGASCQNGPASDGLTVYRQRSVYCPPGYSAAGNKCTRASSKLDVNKNNNCCQAGDNGSNPIQNALGTKLQYERDVDFGGGLSFSRYYSSASHWGSSTIGQHWRHSWSSSISLSDASESGGPVTAWLRRANGDVLAFNRVSVDLWRPEADVVLTLSPVLSPEGAITGWVVKDDDRIEIYAEGRLVAIETAQEGRIRFGYTESGMLHSISNRFGRQIVLDYNSTGQISLLTGPDGQQYSYQYDAIGNLIGFSLLAQNGSSYTKSYLYQDARFPHALTGIVAEDGSQVSAWTYDVNGRAIRSEHGASGSGIDLVSLTFNSDGTTTAVDESGASRVYAFSTSYGVRRLVSSTSPCPSCIEGWVRTRSYDANGFPDLSSDFAGNVTDYDYDARGLMVQKIESVNQPLTRRTIQTDWHPNFRLPTERRILDAAGVLVAKEGWSYNTRGQLLTASRTDPVSGSSRTTTTTYCEQSNIDAGECPLIGLVTSVDGPRVDVADVVRYAYYLDDAAACAESTSTCAHRKGDLWRTTNALGLSTEVLLYDGAGRVLSQRDANGVVTDFSYSPRGWLTARKVRGSDDASEADDAITSIDYSPAGLVGRLTEPGGAVTRFAYDAAHRMASFSDKEGNRIEYLLDTAGHRVQESTYGADGALVRTLSRIYDELGQLRTQADAYASPTDYDYDSSGVVDTVTDALGHVTDLDHDALGRLVRSLQDVGGIAAATAFTYDALDQLIQVDDPKGFVTRYTYDSLGNMVRLQSPDAGTTSYAYDRAGNRISAIDARGLETSYIYDAANRLSGVSREDAALDVAYRYGTVPEACATEGSFARGRLSEMTDGSGSTQYCYDRYGHIVRKQHNIHGLPLTVGYAHDLDGRLSTVDYPGGTNVAYMRDGQGRVVAITVRPSGGPARTLLADVRHAPFGPPIELTYGDGRKLGRPLDQNYRPVRIQDRSPDGLAMGYMFDPIGNLIGLGDGYGVSTLADYRYDALGHLTHVLDGPTGTVLEHYTYDAAGNRLEVFHAGVAAQYSYPADSHRLAGVDLVARSYDDAGNTVQVGTDTYVYDAGNRFTQLLRDGNVLANYAYDGRGEQVWRQVATTCEKSKDKDKDKGKDKDKCKKEKKDKDKSKNNNRNAQPDPAVWEETFAVYDEAGHLLGIYDATGLAQQEIIWLGDLPVGVVAGSGSDAMLVYVEPDHLGTPRVIVDPARQQAIWTWAAQGEAFGATPPNEDPDGDGTTFVFDLRFAGQRYDGASGLNQNGFRDQEVATGRYLQPDPLGLRAGPNLYAYANSEPTVKIDPFGLQIRAPSAHTWRRNSGNFRYRSAAPYTPPGVNVPLTIPVHDPTSSYWESAAMGLSPWDYTMFCVDVWCMRRISADLCSIYDRWERENQMGGYPTVLSVTQRGCECRRALFGDQVHDSGPDQAEMLDAAELATRLIKLRMGR